MILNDPHQNEMSVIGAILAGCKVEEIEAVTRWEDFDHAKAGRAMQGISQLTRDGKTPDLVILARHLPDLADFLVECTQTGVIRFQGPHFAKCVRDQAITRAYKRAAAELDKAAGELEAADLQAYAEKAILSIGASRSATGAPARLGDLVKASVETLKKPLINGIIGVPTGSQKADWLLNGFQPGKLYVIAAWPGDGKTSKAFCHGMRAAKSGYWAHGFWLEMPDDETGLRALSHLSGYDSYDLTGRKVPTDDLADAVRRSDLPFTFDFELFDFEQILSRARNLARQGVKLFLFDYLLLFDTRERFERDDLKLGYFTRNLKQLAKLTKTPVVCLTQFKKEAKRDTIPDRNDIYGSSKIINDADVIELLYDPVLCKQVPSLAQYKDEESCTQMMRGIIAKNRAGREGRVDYRFDKKTTSYSDWDGPEPVNPGF